MEKQIHFLKNIIFAFKQSFIFSKIQYFLALFNIIWDSALPFINLYFPKLILDELSYQKSIEKVFFYIALLIVVNLFTYIVKLCINILCAVSQNRRSIKEGVHYSVMNADMNYEFLENGRILNEEKIIASNLSFAFWAHKPIAAFITNFIQLIGYLYILITLNPIIIIFLLVIIFLSSRNSKTRCKIKYDYEPENACFNRKSTYLFNALVGFEYAKEIRINNAGGWILNRYQSEVKEHLDSFKKNQKNNFKMDVYTDIIAFFQTIIVYVYSAYKVISQQISIGDFSVYVSAVSAFISSFNGIVDKFQQLKYLSNYIDMYKNLTRISHDEVIVSLPECNEQNTRGVIEFQNVSFKYPNSHNYALKNISFSISKDEKVSIVGYNGSGKSTIIKLICRLYKPTEGRILLNGVDIWSLSMENYNNKLSVVFQDFSIFALSLKENICLNNAYSETLMKDSINKSDLDQKIVQLPRNIDTQVSKFFDPAGIEFSGGEYQKIACARAYYKCGSIMLFDEPTSALDPFSESKMYERFNSIIENKTAIYITHRLPIVKYCDKIIVLDNGEIVEQGSHNQLINNNCLYLEMYSKQSEPYISN